MTIPRSCLVDASTTPYYHCIGRCVRRAFLCGHDPLSGRCFEHRRDWVRDKLAILADVFAIHVCAYAVMSNHYHLVLRLNPCEAEHWSLDDVLNRWCTLFSGPMLIQRYLADESLSPGEIARVVELADIYRQRLCSLSWFMKCLNESIARQANIEDQCTGHFWEGRFKSQALLDEQALISCMAYVDLNPIRAGIAETPEDSDYTSIQQRIQECEPLDQRAPKLMKFGNTIDEENTIPISHNDYLGFVDWCGRAIHPHKRGKIPDTLPPIMIRLGIQPSVLIEYLTNKEKGFIQVIGLPQSIKLAAIQYGRQFFKGVTAAKRLYPRLN